MSRGVVTDSPAAPDGRWSATLALRRFGEVLREDGPRGLWFKLLGEAVYRRLGIFELPLPALAPPAAPGIEFAELTSADSELVAELQGLGTTAEIAGIAARLEQGHRCFAAREHGVAVAACWLARRVVPVPYLGVDLPLAADETCSFETWTDPAVRGRGIGPMLRLHIAGALGSDVSRMLAMIYPENAPAIRMVEKLGYRRIGTVAVLRLGSRRRVYLRMSHGVRAPGVAR